MTTCRIVGHTINDGVNLLELYDPDTKAHYQYPVPSFRPVWSIGAMVEVEM